MSPRIPLRELDQAAQNPLVYRTRMDAPSSPEFWRRGHFNVLRDAIRRFHDAHEDAAQARVYLEDGLAKFKDASKRTETMDHFDWYVQEHQSRVGWVTTEVMRRIVVDTPPWTPEDLVVSGEISRMDIVPTGGYVGWLFRNNNVQGWCQELRMPLIQETLAREMRVPLEKVMVGVYGFQQQVTDQKTYSVDEIQAAYSSFEGLLKQLGF